MNQPMVLDIDGSLRGLEGTQTIELSDWQEAIRFGCSWSTWKRFRSFLNERLPAGYGPVCMGNPGSAMNTKRKAHIVRVVIKHNHIERFTVTDAGKQEMTDVVKVATPHTDRPITSRQSLFEKTAEALPG